MNISQATNKQKIILSTTWIFYLFNILYADVLTLMEGMSTKADEGITDTVAILLTPEMLLIAAVLLETAFVMIILSRVLKYSANRRLNITFGALHTAAVTGSLFVATPAIYYVFFATIEITTSLFIVWYAWTWSEAENTSIEQNLQEEVN